MANNLGSSLGKKFLEGFIEPFMSQLVVRNQVTTGEVIEMEENRRKAGEFFYKDRPTDFTSIRTPRGDLTGQIQDIQKGSARGQVQNFISNVISIDQLEKAIELNGENEIMKSLARRLAVDLDIDMQKFIHRTAALTVGTPGTPITQWDQAASMFTLMDSLGIMGEQCAIITPGNRQNLAKAQSGIDNTGLNGTAWERALISQNVGGGPLLSSNGLARHTIGAHGGTLTLGATPTTTYASAKDTYRQTWVITGATPNITGFLKAGDTLILPSRYRLNPSTRQTIEDAAGNTVPFSAKVSADVDSDGGGNVTVVVEGAAFYEAANEQYRNIDSQPTSGDSVQVVGAANTSVTQNLFFSKNAYGMYTVDLPKLVNTVSEVINVEGFSIRITQDSNFLVNTNMVRLDILPAYFAFDQHQAGTAGG